MANRIINNKIWKDQFLIKKRYNLLYQKIG